MKLSNQKFISEFGIKLKIVQSAIHNWGVNADQFIKAGVCIIEYTGEKITRAEEDRREEMNDQTNATYIFQLNERFSLDGAVGGNESHFINHACDPNCEYQIKNNRIFICSIRDIPKDEELTYDYKFEYSPTDPVTCKCGSPNCRGTINLFK